MRALFLTAVKLDRIYQAGEIVNLPRRKILQLRDLVKPVPKGKTGSESIFTLKGLARQPKWKVKELAIRQLDLPGREVRGMPYDELLDLIRELTCRTPRSTISRSSSR